jgi:hypothetical protein
VQDLVDLEVIYADSRWHSKHSYGGLKDRRYVSYRAESSTISARMSPRDTTLSAFNRAGARNFQ